jgi:hypothetical protein
MAHEEVRELWSAICRRSQRTQMLLNAMFFGISGGTAEKVGSRKQLGPSRQGEDEEE